jgi:hypothetical protein
MPWKAFQCSDQNLAQWSNQKFTAQILGEERDAVPIDCVQNCAARLYTARDILRKSYAGMTDGERGAHADWFFAAAMARENLLLLGPPGVAKSEMTVLFFELLSLQTPVVSDELFPSSAPGSENASARRQAWLKREEMERKTQKYFHYLLGRFTQPEELFGPIDISLLREGILVRINHGLMTGAGVRAAFLDEIFKASSSILNMLLTIALERRHFNWGGMEPSDLMILIGASNEMPGGLSTGMGGAGAGAEDFQTLHAFIDRFPIRLYIQAASGGSHDNPQESDLGRATEMAIKRNAVEFTTGNKFEPRKPSCINDMLLLGRACMQQLNGTDDAAHGLFEPRSLTKFNAAFMQKAVNLQQRGTAASEGRVTWTISPRKLKAIYKIALAHALVQSEEFRAQRTRHVVLDPHRDLRALELIWDSRMAVGELSTQIQAT